MGKNQHQTSKSSHTRKKYNNNNPYNKLNLNKFHQIGAKTHSTESHKLHKKKRDLQRLIKFKQDKKQQISQNVNEALQKITTQLDEKKKVYEKNMRKQFFLTNKYKQIMEIQMRKVNKKIKSLHQESMNQNNKKELQEWQKKQRYIKFFPKNLKYVSLFPSKQPLQQGAKQFQKKIMEQIQQRHLKEVKKRNEYKSENSKDQLKTKKAKKDQFFIEQQQVDQEEQELLK